MNEEHRSDQKSWNGKPIADLFHSRTSRTKSRRCNIRATEVINSTTNSDVYSSHGALTDKQRPSVVTGLAHLRNDCKETRGSSIGKNERRYSRNSFGERRVSHNLKVRYPGAFLGGRYRSTLDTHSDGHNKDYRKQVSTTKLQIVHKT